MRSSKARTVCDPIQQREGGSCVQRILGVHAPAKKHDPAVIDEGAKATLEIGVPTYRFLREYLERRPAAALTLRHVDPLILQRTLLSRSRRKGDGRLTMNLVELDHAPRKLRLSGMADVLEARLPHAQAEKLAPST